MISRSWCESHLILPLGVLLSMGAVCIIHSKIKDDYSFIDKKGSKVKGCDPSTEGQWKVCDSEFITSLCTNASKPHLVLIWDWLNWCEGRFTTNLLPQTPSGFLAEVGEFYTGNWFPSCIFNVIVPDEIGNTPLEYMAVQILDSLSARMRH